MADTNIRYYIREEAAKYMAEEFTGIFQMTDKIEFREIVDEASPPISREAARSLLSDGKEVFVNGAGAGTYIDVFYELGFNKIVPFELTSSTGDWSFLVKDTETGLWYIAFQKNAYPSYGFCYSINGDYFFDNLCEAFRFVYRYDDNIINEDDLREFVEDNGEEYIAPEEKYACLLYEGNGHFTFIKDEEGYIKVFDSLDEADRFANNLDDECEKIRVISLKGVEE